jgi:hypothetical protein
MKVVNAFLDPILKDALEKRSTAVEFDKNEFADDQTLVDHLVNLTSGEIACYHEISVAKTSFSDFKIIKDETLNILLAGRDTVSLSLPLNNPGLK